MSEQHTSPVPMIRLHDGTEIPQVGLGVLRIDDEGVTPVVELGARRRIPSYRWRRRLQQ